MATDIANDLLLGAFAGDRSVRVIQLFEILQVVMTFNSLPMNYF